MYYSIPVTCCSASDAVLGISYSSGAWTWLDGEEALPIPWQVGDDGLGSSYAFITDQAYFAEASASDKSYGICQSQLLGNDF